MRDRLKDKDYFSNYLAYQNKRIDKFEQIVQKTIVEKGRDFAGVKTGQIVLLNFYLDKVSALYSYGVSLQEIRMLYSSIVKCFVNTWNKDGSYSVLLKVLSLAVLLEVSKKDCHEVLTHIQCEKVTDDLISLMENKLNSDIPRTFDKEPEYSPYNFLESVVINNDKYQAAMMLKRYLESEWYSGHDDTGWYDSHKDNSEIYCGYWSYEAGAVAKILQINDDELKNQPYYPYDMVHNKG